VAVVVLVLATLILAQVVAAEWRMVLLMSFLDRLYRQSQLVLVEQVIQPALELEVHQVSVL
jgi:hypothetical protein